jgi:hypothetical protein
MYIKIIRCGITRDVILTRRYAIKIPTPRHGLWSLARGILANQSEAEWHNCGDVFGENSATFANNVAPVLRSFLGGLLNVYPRCEPLTTHEGALLMADQFGGPGHEEARQLDLMFPAIGLHLGDMKPTNVGWLTRSDVRRLVWVDYDMSYNGCPHDRSGLRNG